ncbi:BspA family leucine-rich repeat surface protein [Leuconostoc pseudomesenteroides]|uniref:BspA family leucine-rich repeat surface protein n=1 Tax=Leuconostoc pseudomesenteroides TaxID=33968 RepID=UPI0039ED8ABB
MFQSTGLTDLDLSDWDVTKVTTFSYMFLNASKLTTLNLSNWGVGRTATSVNMNYIFSGTSALATLNLTNFKTTNVSNMIYMFQSTGLTSLDLSDWDTTKVAGFIGMFKNASKLTELNLSNWGVGSIAVNINMSYMFQNASLTELDLSSWDVTKVKSFSYMFQNANKLTSLNLSGWGISRTVSDVNMSYMFYNTVVLNNLNLTNFKTTNVTNMSYMFATTGLTSLDLGDWDVTKITAFGTMFASTPNLTTLNLAGWGEDRTATNVGMSYMFQHASALTNLNLTNFSTTNVTNMNSMFQGTVSLTSVDLRNWDVSKVTSFGNMFHSDTNLKILDLSAWNNVVGANSTSAMFYNTTNLWKIIIGDNFKFGVDPRFTSAPSIGTTITDNGQNYKTTSASWQIVGNGTDHHPNGDMVTTTEMYADRSEPVTYVWAQSPTFDGVANLTFGTLGAGDFRNGNKPLATNMATGSVNLINLESGIPYKVSVVQTSDWTTSGQSATISKNDLSIQYGDNSLTDSVDFWSGNSTTSQKSILFNHNTANAFSIWLNPNAVIDTILLGKQLRSELTWTLSETP